LLLIVVIGTADISWTVLLDIYTGHDFPVQDCDGLTPLHVAALHRNAAATLALLQTGMKMWVEPAASRSLSRLYRQCNSCTKYSVLQRDCNSHDNILTLD
jgi:ankyrin repeat protein